MPPASRKYQSGFTLIEMSSAVAIMMMLGITLLIMLNQHIQFLRMFQAQSFLASEAPSIGNLVGRIVNQADHYFVYADRSAATGGGNPLLTGGRAVRLFFKAADQTVSERVIAMEPASGNNRAQLRFYGWLADGTERSWTISDKLNDADFISTQGILNLTLRGPNGEEITYGGGAK